MANKDYLNDYRIFFENFAQSLNPNDQLPVRLGRYRLSNKEVVGAIIDWTSQYLNEKKCPQHLISTLTAIVIDETRKLCKKQTISYGFNPSEDAYEPLKLMQGVVALINEICKRYLDNSMLCSLPAPGAPYNIVSTFAIKNGRRYMEDRHVVINDLNVVFNKKEATPSSYYAIFDGHAGYDAAVYCATHLHQYLAENVNFPSNAEQALFDAFYKTDEMFLAKCQVENFVSGTTAVCALLLPKEKTLYIAWVGDSQALLVKQGEILQCVEPHKPNREDERARIEKQGGSVIHWGMWRVNGQLAVSRAIGDSDYKPFISAIPDIREVLLEGTEDFLILACDGFWDHIAEEDAANIVYDLICENPNDTDRVSQRLVLRAKENGSVDNITVIVVFVREPNKIASQTQTQRGRSRRIGAMDAAPQLDNQNNPFCNNQQFAIEKEQQHQQDTDMLMMLENPTKRDRIATPDFDGDDFGPETLVDAPTFDDFARTPTKPDEPTAKSAFDIESSENNNKLFETSTNGDRASTPNFENDNGPETIVDVATLDDESATSPNGDRAKSPLETDSSMNNNKRAANPFASDFDDDDDDEEDEEKRTEANVDEVTTMDALTPSEEAPPTAPISDVHDAGLIDTGIDSDSEEEEWNYVRGEEANKENLDPSQLIAQVAAELEESMSQLNPDAAEFVPFSPTKNIASPLGRVLGAEDPIISQSPKKAAEVDFFVPNSADFEKEVKTKPHEVEDEAPSFSNGHSKETNGSPNPFADEVDLLNKDQQQTEEFHFGPNASPFIPNKLFERSETSTRALFGDESVLSLSSSINEGIPDLTCKTDPMSMSFHQDRDEPADLNKVHQLPEDSFMNQTISDLEEHFPLSNAEQTRPELITDLDADTKNEDLNNVEEQKVVEDLNNVEEQKVVDDLIVQQEASPVVASANLLDLVPNFIDKPTTLDVEREVLSSETSSQLTSPVKTPDVPRSDMDLIAEQISAVNDQPRQTSPIPDLVADTKSSDLIEDVPVPSAPILTDDMFENKESVPVPEVLAESPKPYETEHNLLFSSENPFMENTCITTEVEVHAPAVETKESSAIDVISNVPQTEEVIEEPFRKQVTPEVEEAALLCPLPATPKSPAVDTESLATTDVNSFLERSVLADFESPLSAEHNESSLFEMKTLEPTNVNVTASSPAREIFDELVINTSTPQVERTSISPQLEPIPTPEAAPVPTEIPSVSISPIATETKPQSPVKAEPSKTAPKKEPPKTRTSKPTPKKPLTVTKSATKPATPTTKSTTARPAPSKTTTATTRTSAGTLQSRSKIDSARPAGVGAKTSASTIDKKPVNGLKTVPSTTTSKSSLASKMTTSTLKPATAKTTTTAAPKPKPATSITRTALTKPAATPRSPAATKSTTNTGSVTSTSTLSSRAPITRPKATTLAAKEPLTKPIKEATNKLTATRAAPRTNVTSKIGASARPSATLTDKTSKPATARTAATKVAAKKPNEPKPITKPKPKENGVSEPPKEEIVNGIGDK